MCIRDRSYSLEMLQQFEMYNEARNFKTQYWPWGNQGIAMQNPYWIVNRDNFINHKNRFLMSGGLSFEIMKGITLGARAKMDYTSACLLYTSQYYLLFVGQLDKSDLYTVLYQCSWSLEEIENSVREKWYARSLCFGSNSEDFRLAQDTWKFRSDALFSCSGRYNEHSVRFGERGVYGDVWRIDLSHWRINKMCIRDRC